MKQIEINFEGGLLSKYGTFREAVIQTAYGSPRQLKAIAADLDMSPSELSRKLKDNPNDNVEYPLHRFDELLESSEDLTALLWLVEKYLDDADSRKKQAVSKLLTMMPELQELLREASKE